MEEISKRKGDSYPYIHIRTRLRNEPETRTYQACLRTHTQIYTTYTRTYMQTPIHVYIYTQARAVCTEQWFLIPGFAKDTVCAHFPLQIPVQIVIKVSMLYLEHQRN